MRFSILSTRSHVFALAALLATAALCSAAPPTARDAGIWLQQRAAELVRAAATPMENGVTAFPPQAGDHYHAFWLRDYAYQVEGCPEAFTKKELQDACLTFVGALRSDGAGVDHIAFDGTPDYRPLANASINPVADGSQFTVDVAWRTYQQIKSPELLNQIIDPLVKTMNAAPRNPATGLIHIDPSVGMDYTHFDRCAYGFTDAIHKRGDELYSSLLDVRASRQLADLLDEAGRSDEAASWRTMADAETATIRNTFWDETTGLFRAATVQCNQPDIWGSAFAIQLGVATPEQSMRIAQYLKDHYSEVVQAGQVRHLPGGMAWERSDPAPGTYQNGGFWGVGTGWIIEALQMVDPQLAEQTVIDMVDNYQQRGVYEWVHGDGSPDGVRNYTSSATLPMASLRKLYEIPEPDLSIEEVGGRASVGNIAAASRGATAFAKDVIDGYPEHNVDCLNDGVAGNGSTWIAGSDASFAGVAFDKPYTIGSLAIGRDNLGAFNDRYQGMYTFQYTCDPEPSLLTPDAAWTTFGQIDARFENDFGARRHLYQFPPISGVTGVRVLIEGSVPGQYVGIDEFEVYHVPEPGSVALAAIGTFLAMVYAWKNRKTR